jgi:hypothetical protein
VKKEALRYSTVLHHHATIFLLLTWLIT